MANPSPITFQQLFRFWRALPHQSAAIVELEEDIKANGYTVAMRRNRPWFATWSQDGKQPDAPAPAKPGAVRLAVPYFPQGDNGPEGWRQCQTSAIAMALAYLKVAGIRDDLDYLKVVERFGDTTSQAAHMQALARLGAPGRFRQDVTAEQVAAEIRGGRPVALGVLHHGPVTAPAGGGHWILAIGFDDDGWICHDPYGELDLVHGGWSRTGGTSGRAIEYSRRNLGPRVWVEGPASGWAWLFS